MVCYKLIGHSTAESFVKRISNRLSLLFHYNNAILCQTGKIPAKGWCGISGLFGKFRQGKCPALKSIEDGRRFFLCGDGISYNIFFGSGNWRVVVDGISIWLFYNPGFPKKSVYVMSS